MFSFPIKHFPQQTNTWNLPFPSQVVEIFVEIFSQSLSEPGIKCSTKYSMKYSIPNQPWGAEQLPWNDSSPGRSQWTSRPQETPGVTLRALLWNSAIPRGNLIFHLPREWWEKLLQPQQVRTKLMSRRSHPLFSTSPPNELPLKTSGEHFKGDLFCLC